MTKPVYRWRNIEEYLDEQANARIAINDIEWLRQAVAVMIKEVDSETLENTFGIEADMEGYYDPLCPECDGALERVGDENCLMCESCYLLWQNREDNEPRPLCEYCLCTLVEDKCPACLA